MVEEELAVVAEVGGRLFSKQEHLAPAVLLIRLPSEKVVQLEYFLTPTVPSELVEACLPACR